MRNLRSCFQFRLSFPWLPDTLICSQNIDHFHNKNNVQSRVGVFMGREFGAELTFAQSAQFRESTTRSYWTVCAIQAILLIKTELSRRSKIYK